MARSTLPNLHDLTPGMPEAEQKTLHSKAPAPSAALSARKQLADRSIWTRTLLLTQQKLPARTLVLNAHMQLHPRPSWTDTLPPTLPNSLARTAASSVYDAVARKTP